MMIKRMFSLFCVLALCLTLLPGMTLVAAVDIIPSAPTNGNGTEAAPYQISTVEELYWFAELVNSGRTSICAVLMNDITVNTGVLDEEGKLNSSTFEDWTPIGNSSTAYTGSFDGQGYTISGLYVNSTSNSDIYVGLFGSVGGDGTVRNVGVADSYLSACTTGMTKSACAGGVCGTNHGTIEGCWNSGTVTATATNNMLGGYAYAGGVCGANFSAAIITNCWNSGSVDATSRKKDAESGGVCGLSFSNIENCWNRGTVTATANSGSAYIGGVCGFINFTTNGTITNCYWLETAASSGIGTSFGTGTGDVTKKTEDNFASGEVTRLLNGQSTNGPWRQTLGVDDYPVLDYTHGAVYQVTVTDEDARSTDYYCNESFTLPDAPEETKIGYSFSWSDGKGNNYAASKTVTIIADTTFTAQWTANTYTVKFDGNGSDGGTMSSQAFTYDTAQTLMANTFTRTGYTFAGWNTKADGSGISYEDREELTLTDNLTLYAQ